VQDQFIAAALCAVGAEKAVSNEIRKLGLRVAEGGFGRVRFRTDLPGLYRALMGLRAADRVLVETGRFPAPDFDALFEGAKNIAWEEYIPRGMGLVVTKVRTNRSRLRAETAVQSMVHKAAAERLCKKFRVQRLPEDGDLAELRVYIEKDQVSLLLDLSGEPLFKRGYRIEGGIAPLRETTAAAIILLAGWKRKFPLRDPFCGSGTIVIEAAMYAWDMAPGLGRRFSLEKLLISDRGVEKQVRDEFWGRIDFSRTMALYGSDADAGAAVRAGENLERLWEVLRGRLPADRKPSLPEFRTLPMKDARPAPEESGGFIITNPPYGKRLGSPEEAEGIYAGMGELARNFPGWKLGVMTDHPGFESFFGRGANSCREITGGAVNGYFYLYDRL
jgi:putative N6-adenine-specific DNA methylase